MTDFGSLSLRALVSYVTASVTLAACTASPISTPSPNPSATPVPSGVSATSVASPSSPPPATPLPTPSASAIAATASPSAKTASPSPVALVTPIVGYLRSEGDATATGRYTRFWFGVSNWSDYDQSLFEPAPDLAPCGLNTDSSRMWLEIWNADSHQRLYGFCALTDPAEMDELSFAVEVGQQVPVAFLVSLTDRRTGQTAESAPVPIPPRGFAIAWKEHPPDFGQETTVVASSVIDNRIVVIGSAPDGGMDRPAIWWEDGDLAWRRAQVPSAGFGASLSGIVVGGPGLVVVGTENDNRALLWLSADGKVWKSADPSVLDGSLWSPTPPLRIGVADGGLIVLGRHGEPFVSANGRDWHVSSDENTRDMANGAFAFAGSGSQLTGFSTQIDAGACGEVTGDPCRVGAIRVWRSNGPDAWTMVGELPDSTGRDVIGAAVGPRGWVAVGNEISWLSADGIDWQRSDESPQMPLWVERVAIFGTTAGFTAVGDYYVNECVIDGGYRNSVTWTSSDGSAWDATDSVRGLTEASLRRRGDMLILIGTVGQLGGPYGAAWTASLPSYSSAGGPAQSPVPLPPSEVCGP